MRTPFVLLVDLVCVVAFATLGRGAHGEAVGVAQVADTAWPFLVGCLAGWGVLRAWRTPLRLGTAAGLMAITVVVGHSVRVLAGGSTHWTFVVVSIVALTVLLLGWRIVARTILRRQGVHAS
ncbi:Protein of unknown function [Raineyella antarctica]|uniref:DUF3054 domain-containing protein n=1 Tax=Raineyella antarctica TaxID=1577474 RepID=A0A1G6HKC6_9ACTN|nr:DUF3054 domain-containing protein [Raineyella antarctica]SDB93876.1 Protein of unknown function [Raineyella antarctica]